MEPLQTSPLPRSLPLGRALRARAAAGAGVALAALALTACGSSSGSAQPSRATPLAQMTGRQIFQTQGCAGCHTLAAAGATGSVGPDLDDLKPTDAAVVKQVTDGGGGMPSFRTSLSHAEIERVATFVSAATH